jgi:hypothetical protein
MTTLPRVLFAISELPTNPLSVKDIRAGMVAVSGAISCSLLVIDGLARRGHRVGFVVLRGPAEVDISATTFTSLEEALSWVGPGWVIKVSWGDESALEQLLLAGCCPLIWTHVHLSTRYIEALSRGQISGILFVSDLARLPHLHRRAYRKLGRVHNPLNPAFKRAEAVASESRHGAKRVVFTGHVGEVKGAHRLFQMWPKVRQRVPAAKLLVCGSNQLYGCRRVLGKYGVAEPEFETKYLAPLERQSGSLEASGLELTGLMTPAQLRDLYPGMSLGVVNCNWNGSTETFCCSAVEMLATGLPVFSFARGALPETIGRSGGAVLATRADLDVATKQIAHLLTTPDRLLALSKMGRAYVESAYDLDSILNHWERLLSDSPEHLYENTPWDYHRSRRYYLKRTVGRLGLERLEETARRVARRILRRRGD